MLLWHHDWLRHQPIGIDCAYIYIFQRCIQFYTIGNFWWMYFWPSTIGQGIFCGGRVGKGNSIGRRAEGRGCTLGAYLTGMKRGRSFTRIKDENTVTLSESLGVGFEEKPSCGRDMRYISQMETIRILLDLCNRT